MQPDVAAAEDPLRAGTMLTEPPRRAGARCGHGSARGSGGADRPRRTPGPAPPLQDLLHLRGSVLAVEPHHRLRREPVEEPAALAENVFTPSRSWIQSRLSGDRRRRLVPNARHVGADRLDREMTSRRPYAKRPNSAAGRRARGRRAAAPAGSR
jgi:hypothetical protein